MKRLIMSLILCLVALLAIFCGCGEKVLDRPPEMTDKVDDEKVLDRPPEIPDNVDEVKTLEFWVGEKVEGSALEGHTLIVGMFGGYEYFGSGYCDKDRFIPWEDEYPEYYVTYTLTAYPDYSSGDSDTVTGIEITDPKVWVYGINCNCSVEEFAEAFSSIGCEVETGETGGTATYGKTTVSLTAVEGARALRISVEVTNKTGMDF